jgi:hypothetical protein
MSEKPATAPESAFPLFASLAGLTSLGIFLQAISAGQFMSGHSHHTWVNVHSIIGNATLLVALVTAVVATVQLRKVAGSLVGWTWGLFVLLVIQVGTGQLVANHHKGWVGLHVPVALIVFGLTVWLSVRSALLRRQLSGS